MLLYEYETTTMVVAYQYGIAIFSMYVYSNELQNVRQIQMYQFVIE